MNLSNLEFLQNNSIFSTRDFAINSKISVSSATRILNRMTKKNELKNLTRGFWVYDSKNEVHPFSLSPYLIGNANGYISLLSALHIHGVISQIPTRIQIVSTNHQRILKTNFGIFEFFQMKPNMINDGINWSNTKLPYRIASIEKAILDIFYLSTRKGKRFSFLPELELKETNFKKKKFFSLLKKQNFSSSIHKAILIKAEKFLNTD